jgi:hypothetical protein
MKYRLFSEGDNNCVRSSLKSILDRRTIAIPGDEEFETFFPRIGKDMDLDIEKLSKFLEQYQLQARQVRPNCSMIEVDDILEQALNKEDIMAAFHFNVLVGSERIWRHVTLVQDFQYPNITLHDYSRSLDLGKMRKAMSQDSRCGFYFIS